MSRRLSLVGLSFQDQVKRRPIVVFVARCVIESFDGNGRWIFHAGLCNGVCS